MGFIISKRYSQQSILNFIGQKAAKSFILVIIQSFLLFAVELLFAASFQQLLVSFGFLTVNSNFMENKWLYWMTFYPVISFIIICILKSILNITIDVEKGLTVQAFNAYQRKNILKRTIYFPELISTHESISLFGDGVNRAGQALNSLQIIIYHAILGLGFFISCLVIAPRMTIAIFVFLSLFIIPYKYFSRNYSQYGDDLYAEWLKLSEVIINAIKHALFIKVYNLEKKTFQESSSSLSKYYDTYKKYLTASSIKTHLPILLGTLVIAIMVTASRYFKTDFTLAYFYLLMRLFQAIGQNLGHFINLKTQKNVLLSLADLNGKEVSEDESSATLTSISSLRCRNVSYHYPANHELVVKNISIDLHKGDFLIIKGESGKGKSTLVKLMLGQFTPVSGEVIINDKHSAKVLKVNNQFVGYSESNPFLISGTLRDNLVLGLENNDSISDKDILQALELACATEFTKKLPDGLNTFLSEIPAFSTGQKQRISIARTLLRKPELIILDEFSSNLDPETERKIFDNILKNRENSIIILISHRSSFDEIANKRIDF